jgi:hypothetical protein
MGKAKPKMVAYIETGWIERFNSCQPYRYEFDSTGFESLNDPVIHVSDSPHAPINVQAMGSPEY